MAGKQATENADELKKSADELWNELTGGKPIITDPGDDDYWFKTAPEKQPRDSKPSK